MVSEREFLDFVSNILRVDSARLSLVTAYESLPEWDSVMHIRLVMEISGEYGVDFPLERIPELKTLSDFWQVVSMKYEV